MGFKLDPTGVFDGATDASSRYKAGAQATAHTKMFSWFSESFTIYPSNRVGAYATASGAPGTGDYSSSIYPANSVDSTTGAVYAANDANPYNGATTDVAFAAATNTYHALGAGASKGSFVGGTSYGTSPYNMDTDGYGSQMQFGMVIACRVQGSYHNANRGFISLRDANYGQHAPAAFYNVNAQTSNGSASTQQLLDCYQNPRKMTPFRTAQVSGSAYPSYVGLNFVPMNVGGGTTKINETWMINEGYTWITVYGWGYGIQLRKDYFDHVGGL
jgi:hypothetical protein